MITKNTTAIIANKLPCPGGSTTSIVNIFESELLEASYTVTANFVSPVSSKETDTVVPVSSGSLVGSPSSFESLVRSKSHTKVKFSSESHASAAPALSLISSPCSTSEISDSSLVTRIGSVES